MKILSETKDGGRVVEWTPEEWREFAKLALAVEGMTEDDAVWAFETHRVLPISTEPTRDYSGVFGAILAYREARLKINELEIMLNGFKKHVLGDAK